MTEREYIMSKLTYFKLFGVRFNWDRISNNLFMWPVAVFALETQPHVTELNCCPAPGEASLHVRYHC